MNKNILKNIVIFLVILAYFFLLQGTTHFADPDCFYNTRMALMMKENLIFKEFPWLQYSVLKDNYIDHHFLYHVFLIPFVSLNKIGISPLLGVRISAMFFASLLIFIFYLILNNLSGFTRIDTLLRQGYGGQARKNADISNPSLFFIFLLLISTPFIFRISLARAPAISGIFLLLGTYFILKNRGSDADRHACLYRGSNAEKFSWPLFVISFFYVWLYSAWLLLPVILVFYLVACLISSRGKWSLSGSSKMAPGILLRQGYGGQGTWSQHTRWFASIRNAVSKNLNKIVSIISGIILGLIINPYFPANLKFYYHQIVQIAVINFHAKFGVGAEWYPYEPIYLYKNLFIFFIFLLVAIALFFVFTRSSAFAPRSSNPIAPTDKKPLRAMADKLKDRNRFLDSYTKCWALFLITSFFLIYTFKARRSVEYLVPFGVLFIASVYDNIFNKKSWQELEARFKQFFSKKQQMILVIIVSTLVFISPYIIYHDIANAHQQLQHFKFNYLQDASQWLKENVEPGQTIFNSNWDHFGHLFYYNPNNYYITGLDQTFMYSYNPELLELYIDITKGFNIINLKDNLLNKFNSEYILVSKDRNQKLYRNLNMLSKDFERVYEGEELSIFKVKSKQ